jgi:diaminopimelate epimerase
MAVKFVKMHGAGNDFIVVDEWSGVAVPERSKRSFVCAISDRHFGVGSDGVIFVQKSQLADAKFHYFNPDGSLAEMCGNGIRCFAKYVYERGLAKKTSMRVETRAGVRDLTLFVRGGVVDAVRVSMGAPQLLRKEAQVAGKPGDSMINESAVIDGVRYRITSVGMGNPHAVLFVNDVNAIDVACIGSKIRNYLSLFPNGTNVHFVQKTGRNEFSIRTYERGVEGETLACGTGICASAVAAVLNKKADPSKTIKFNSRGGALSVELAISNGRISNIYLIGPAEKVFDGSFEYGKSGKRCS